MTRAEEGRHVKGAHGPSATAVAPGPGQAVVSGRPEGEEPSGGAAAPGAAAAPAQPAQPAEAPAPGWRDRPLSRRATWAAALLVVAQVAAVVVFGAITILRYPLWSPVDEGAHFDNVLYVAEHGSYPVLGKTLASEQELAIGQGVYPRHTTINPKTYGLGGLSYEAFQPPLYYYVAAPVFYLSGNYHTKAILLRFFGLFLLLVAIALFARLSRHVLRKRWLLGVAGGMLIFLMPGVIVRMVTIANLNLALPLGVLIGTELWITWQRRSAPRLLLCGVLVGCGVLTDLYLAEFIPVIVAVALYVLWAHRTRRDLLWAGAGALGAFLVLLPWLAFNEAKYHLLFAGSIAQREQLSIVNPHHVYFPASQVPGLTVQTLFQPLMPQEWGGALAGANLLSYLAVLFQVLLVPAAIVLAVLLGRRIFRSGSWVLLAPWVINIVLCWYIDVGQQWQSGAMVPRYTYATLPLLGMFVIAGVMTLSRSIRPYVVTVVLSSVFLVALWVHLLPVIRSS